MEYILVTENQNLMLYHLHLIITCLITEGSKTNNTAELKAIESALTILENYTGTNNCNINKSKEIVIISDSQYAIKCITLWYIKWRKNY